MAWRTRRVRAVIDGEIAESSGEALPVVIAASAAVAKAVGGMPPRAATPEGRTPHIWATAAGAAAELARIASAVEAPMPKNSRSLS